MEIRKDSRKNRRFWRNTRNAKGGRRDYNKITNAKLEKYNISLSQKDAFLEYGSDTGMSIEISGYFVGTIYTARNISKCEIHLAIHEPELLEWMIGNNYDDREHEIVFHGRIAYIDKKKFKVYISCEVIS